MAESIDRLEEEIVQRIAQGWSGAIDQQDGKKRWVFYFVDGRLIYTRSNLKTEHEDSIREGRPNLSDDAVARLQAIRRIRNACRAPHGERSVHEDAAPRGEMSIPTLPVLLRAVMAARSEDELLAAIGPVLDGWPATAGDLSDLGVGDEVAGYLTRLDGARLGRDVVEFAPGPRAEVLATLWLAWRLSRIIVGAAASEGTVVEASKPAVGLDIAAFIAEEVTQEIVPVPPEPEPQGASHEVSALPRRQRATIAPPPKPRVDPMEVRLRELHARVTAASNHFEVLGVPWDAEPEAFRKAHLELAQHLHPDRYADAAQEVQDLATTAFDRIRAAWEVLGAVEARAAYVDRIIHGKKTDEELAMEQVQAYWAGEAEFKRGLAAFNAGRIVQAHENFRAAVEAVPDELEFRAYYGFSTFMLNHKTDPQQAESGMEMLKEVLERNKEQERKLDTAWVLLGRIYRERGEDRAAKRCFVQALRINPANPDAQREMRRLGSSDDKGKANEKKGLFSRLFGKKS